MPNPISPLCRSLTPYVPGEQPKPGEDLLKLNTNENPYPPAPGVEGAIRRVIDRLALYPDPQSAGLCRAIAARHGVAENQVFVGNGSDEVLGLCFPAFFQRQPLPVAFADITYSFYEVYAGLFSTETAVIPLQPDFTMDVGAFIHTPNAGVLLANPNAPTGLCLSPDDILRIAAAHPHSAVVVDEAYVEFGAPSMIPYIPKQPNLVVVRTLSKSHALAGLRVGYAVGDAALIAALWTVKDSFNSFPLDQLAQAGAAAAIEDDDYTRAQCEKIMHTRDAFSTALKERGFAVLESRANFVFAKPPRGDAATLLKALRQQGILVRHFQKPRIQAWLRISIGTDAQMQRLLRAIDAALGAL